VFSGYLVKACPQRKQPKEAASLIRPNRLPKPRYTLHARVLRKLSAVSNRSKELLHLVISQALEDKTFGLKNKSKSAKVQGYARLGLSAAFRAGLWSLRCHLLCYITSLL